MYTILNLKKRKLNQPTNNTMKDKIEEAAKQLYPIDHNDEIFTPTVRQLQQNAYIKGALSKQSPLKGIEELQRYMFMGGVGYEDGVKSDKGEWVKFADVKALRTSNTQSEAVKFAEFLHSECEISPDPACKWFHKETQTHYDSTLSLYNDFINSKD